MTTALVLYQAGNLVLQPGPQHRHRGLGGAPRHHRHPTAPAARTHLQHVPRRAGVVAATVPAVRRAHPPGGRRERAGEPPSRRARHLRVGRVHLPRHHAARAPRRDVHDGARQGHRTGRIHRRRQVEHRQAPRPHLRPRRGRGEGQRHRPPRPPAPQLPPASRHRPAGPVRVQRHDRLEHPVREAGRDRRRGRGGDPRRRRLGSAVRAARPVRARRRGRRTQPHRRAAPAHRPGTGVDRGARHPGARRVHVAARHRGRGHHRRVDPHASAAPR